MDFGQTKEEEYSVLISLVNDDSCNGRSLGMCWVKYHKAVKLLCGI